MAGNATKLTRTAKVVLLAAIVGFPIAWVIGYSALYSVGIGHLFADEVTLRYWQDAFTTGGLKESLFYTPAIAFVVTFVSVSTAIVLTLLSPGSRNNPLLLAMLCIPVATPGAVIALLVYQILSPGGVLARLAFHAGVIQTPTEFPVFVNDYWGVGIIIAQACGMFPLMALFFLKTWTSCHADKYCRLAESLGASRWQARIGIALPMLLKRGRSLILLMFLLSLGSYEIPLILGRQSPQMFSVLTQRRFGQYNLEERPEAFVLATVYLVLAGMGVQLLLMWRRRYA